MEVSLQIARVVAVIALLCISAALSTPPGRLPLALRGLRRVMRRDAGLPDKDAASAASPLRRCLSFLFLVLAILLVVI